ncbi:MAG: SapC family protein [Gammaproteobacteria bacterium]
MTKQVLLYEKAVPVSSERHRNWSIRMSDDYSFARNVGWVPLVVGEFAAAAHEYPIVFAKSGDSVTPVAVLGLAGDQNLYLDSENKWQARYVPAFVRRYPFIFSTSQDGNTLALCIDEEFVGCNQDGRGERLFDSDGAQTQYCKNVTKFLAGYQSEFVRTQAFGRKLVELDLLEQQTARFQANAGAPQSLTGFMGISHERLKNLPGDTLSELAVSGEMDYAWCHLFSMASLRSLAERTSSADISTSPEGVAASESTGIDEITSGAQSNEIDSSLSPATIN